MILHCQIRSELDDSLLRTENRETVCGRDFCDRCGDCLNCFGGDPCYDGSEDYGAHLFIVYEDR